VGDACITTNTLATSVAVAPSFAATFGDATAYYHTRLCTLRNMQDGASLTNALGQLMGLFLEHTDMGQAGTSGDTGNIYRVDEFNAGYGERVDYYDAKGTRYGGGMQAEYNDDTTLAIYGLSFSNLLVCGAAAAYTGWNGDYLIAYDSAYRVGALAPAGGFDTNIGMQSRKKTGTSESANHTVRMSSMGEINTVSGSGYVAGNLIDAGDNEIILATGGATAYAAAFPTLGAVNDGEGRMSYAWTDDGIETAGAFRTRIYAGFARAKGATNPANWPAI
jgi:hypothetical protein